MADALDTSDLDLGAVTSRDGLAALLREVHVRADRPSLRTLEARTRRGATPLSKTAIAEMLKGSRFPRKAVMVTFLQACGVQDADMESWQRAWEQLAYGEEDLHPRRVASSWHFSDAAHVTVICAQLPEAEVGSLTDPDNPNYTELLSYADLDALVELYGHIRSENPGADVLFRLSSNFAAEDLLGHVVLMGGIAYNEITERISEMSHLPIRQVVDPSIKTGEIFVAGHNGDEQRFLPKFAPEGGQLIEDIGLIARGPNPLNSNRSLTICNGVHSRGVLGAVRALTDSQMRESNEGYIAENFADSSVFAILMRVPVIERRTITPDFNAADSVLYQWPLDIAALQS